MDNNKKAEKPLALSSCVKKLAATIKQLQSYSKLLTMPQLQDFDKAELSIRLEYLEQINDKFEDALCVLMEIDGGDREDDGCAEFVSLYLEVKSRLTRQLNRMYSQNLQRSSTQTRTQQIAQKQNGEPLQEVPQHPQQVAQQQQQVEQQQQVAQPQQVSQQVSQIQQHFAQQQQIYHPQIDEQQTQIDYQQVKHLQLEELQQPQVKQLQQQHVDHQKEEELQQQQIELHKIEKLPQQQVEQLQQQPQLDHQPLAQLVDELQQFHQQQIQLQQKLEQQQQSQKSHILVNFGRDDFVDDGAIQQIEFFATSHLSVPTCVARLMTIQPINRKLAMSNAAVPNIEYDDVESLKLPTGGVCWRREPDPNLDLICF